jgi:AsmA family
MLRQKAGTCVFVAGWHRSRYGDRMKWLKRLIYLCLILVALAFAAVMLLSFAVTQGAERYLNQTLNQPFGNIQIDGQASVHVLPMPNLRIADVAVYPVGNKKKPLLLAKQIKVTLSIKSLFKRKLNIKRLSVNGGQVNYFIRDDGDSNWQRIVDVLKKARKSTGKQPKQAITLHPKKSTLIEKGLKGMSISTVALNNATINYADFGKRTFAIAKILSFAADVKNRKMKLNGSLVLPQGEVGLNVETTLDVQSIQYKLNGHWKTEKTNYPFASTGLIKTFKQATFIDKFTLSIADSDAAGVLMIKPNYHLSGNLSSDYFDFDTAFQLSQNNKPRPLLQKAVAYTEPRFIVTFKKVKVFSKTYDNQKVRLNYYQGTWVGNADVTHWLKPLLTVLFPAMRYISG